MGSILQTKLWQSVFSILLDQYSTLSELINACTVPNNQIPLRLAFLPCPTLSLHSSQFCLFLLLGNHPHFYRVPWSIKKPCIFLQRDPIQQIGKDRRSEAAGGWVLETEASICGERSIIIDQKGMSNYYEGNIFDVIDLEPIEYGEEYDQFNQVIDQENHNCQDDEVFFYEREQLKKDVEEPSNTADTLTDDHECPEDQTFTEELTTESQLPRMASEIQIHPQTGARHAEVAHGHTRETQNLGKNYKTVVKNYLKVIHQGGYFEETEIQALRKFGDTNGGIRDFQQLFQEPQLKKWGRELFSSPNLVREIMQSPKMDMSSKLVMLKYAERLRSTTHSLHSKWKDDAL